MRLEIHNRKAYVIKDDGTIWDTEGNIQYDENYSPLPVQEWKDYDIPKNLGGRPRITDEEKARTKEVKKEVAAVMHQCDVCKRLFKNPRALSYHHKRKWCTGGDNGIDNVGKPEDTGS